jgi:hypothetical protein
MSKETNGGTNITGILLIIFIILKLTHNIDWSWWWVLSPLWIPIAGILAVVILTALIVGIMEAFKRW